MGEVAGTRRHADDRAAGGVTPVGPRADPGRHQRRTVLDAEECPDQVEVDGGPDRRRRRRRRSGPCGPRRRHWRTGCRAGPARRAAASTAAAICSSTVTSATTYRADPHRAPARPPGRSRRRRSSVVDGEPELLLGPSADGHVGAVLDQPGGRPEPDAAAASGDQRGVAGDAVRWSLVPVGSLVHSRSARDASARVGPPRSRSSGKAASAPCPRPHVVQSVRPGVRVQHATGTDPRQSGRPDRHRGQAHRRRAETVMSSGRTGQPQ